MSIPPLVCNTPPPPDQCEDDKDEDYDLQYRLSQEDDEDNNSYDYGNFSSYNNYCQETTVSENTKENKSESVNFSVNAEENILSEETSHTIDFPLNDNTTPKCEDVAVEDLNLKIEQENITSDHLVTHTLHNAVDSDTYGISCIVDHLGSPDKINLASNNNEEDESNDEKSLSETNVTPLDTSEVQEESENTTEIQEVDQIASEINTEPQPIQASIQSQKTDPEITGMNDDFDEFEDFKFTATTISKDEVIANFEDPWDNNDAEDFNFGDFNANFDSDSDNIQSVADGHINNNKDIIVNNLETNENADSDDDFGDFDDFKSSVKLETEDKTKMETQLQPHVTVLNFQCPDNETQIIESINNILFNIFTEDMPNCEPELERTLDSMLTETWHHLKEVDERQPYMVHWNNSLGQKSLLKALCIDSRNILFGPKWNYFTPKYATSLSVAPLQPQKPVAVPNTGPSEVVNSDKVTNKENTSWTDPFTSDGQEYTYAEALLLDLEHLMATLDQMAHKHSTLKISELLSNASTSDKEKSNKEVRPSDLDVFQNAISVTNIDKIHSSTLSVQPLRHINLPDTHIFTPTDSETPRSKTIHYDSGPPVLLPQQVIENHGVNIENPASQHAGTENNDDYWEFQDFKGVTGHTASVPNTGLKLDEKVDTVPSLSSPPTSSGITFQTQLLQPVKVEPVMPTLNWPDPGEVKETFDDFSDFISNSHWSTEGQDVTTKHILPIAQKIDDSVHESSMEDDFETFQSAPTSVANDINHLQTDVNSLEKLETVAGIQKKIDTLSFKSNDSLPLNQNSTTQNNTILKNNSVNYSTRQSPVSHNSVLQPINSAITLRAQQGGQILQPLSLEGYSQINWPKPGIDLQNLSSFNPLESLQSLKSDTGSSGPSKVASPIHNKVSAVQNDISEDDIWGDFVSSKPKQHAPKKTPIFADDDEWTDFVSSPSLAQNSLNTISFNVQTNSNIQKSSNQNSASKSQNISLDIPTLNYITPKSTHHGAYIEKHFQNL